MAMGTRQSKPQLRKQTIPRQATGVVTPLSFGQQGLWFLQQLDPTSPVYNDVSGHGECGVALNVEALTKDAYETVVARHEVLRAVIQVVDGKACQRTNEEWTFPFPCLEPSRILFGSTPEIVCQRNHPPRGENPI